MYKVKVYYYSDEPEDDEFLFETYWLALDCIKNFLERPWSANGIDSVKRVKLCEVVEKERIIVEFIGKERCTNANTTPEA